MAANNTSTPAGETVQYFSVRLPRVTESIVKKYALMKFAGKAGIDFSKCGLAKLERENNYREFKSANDMELLPKSGAGSEFGREQRELARRKKFGMRIRKYCVTDQPYQLRMGGGKAARKFKGVREGGLGDNAAYYIFTQCADGAFEAFPIDDWYQFTPLVKFKFLNSEEAEEQFERRDKTLNYFSIMVNRRIKQDQEAGAEGEEAESGKKAKKTKSGKDKSLTLTEFDEWAEMSEGENDEGSDGEGEESEAKSKVKKKAGGKEKKQGKKKKKKKGSDEEEEPEEESDEESEGERVDYMSGSSSDDEDMYKEKEEENEKYEQKGVEDEDGLRKLVNTDDEEDEEDDDKKDNEEDEEDEGKLKEDKGKASNGESSSSDSDSDLDKMELDVQLDRKPDRKQLDSLKSDSRSVETGSASNGRPSTPSAADSTLKRKRVELPPPAKKAKLEPSVSGGSSSASEGSMEDVIRRYLQRKPMTTHDILRKLKSFNTTLSKDQLVSAVAGVIKKLNPRQSKVKDKMHFSLETAKDS